MNLVIRKTVEFYEKKHFKKSGWGRIIIAGVKKSR